MNAVTHDLDPSIADLAVPQSVTDIDDIDEYERRLLADNAIPGARARARQDVRFFKDPAHDNRVFIEFLGTNDEYRHPVFEATEEYQQRFPREWAAFQRGGDQFVGKHKLAAENWLDEAARRACEDCGIYTVETLAALSPEGRARLGPQGERLQALAQERMREFPASPMERKLKQLEAQNAEMREDMADIKEMLRKLVPPPASESAPAAPASAEDAAKRVREATGAKAPARKPAAAKK